MWTSYFFVPDTLDRSLLGRVAAKVVALAHIDALLAQQSIRSRIVEEEVGNRELNRVVLAIPLQLAAPSLDLDLRLLVGVDVFGLYRGQGDSAFGVRVTYLDRL